MDILSLLHDAPILQKNAGHSNPEMTEHYTKISDAAAVRYAKMLHLGGSSTLSEREHLMGMGEECQQRGDKRGNEDAVGAVWAIGCHDRRGLRPRTPSLGEDVHSTKKRACCLQTRGGNPDKDCLEMVNSFTLYQKHLDTLS